MNKAIWIAVASFAFAAGISAPASAQEWPQRPIRIIVSFGAAGHPNELRVHLQGALKNGCSVEEIQEVLLLVAMYCGIPSANEAHRVAADVLREAQKL